MTHTHPPKPNPENTHNHARAVTTVVGYTLLTAIAITTSILIITSSGFIITELTSHANTETTTQTSHTLNEKLEHARTTHTKQHATLPLEPSETLTTTTTEHITVTTHHHDPDGDTTQTRTLLDENTRSPVITTQETTYTLVHGSIIKHEQEDEHVSLLREPAFTLTPSHTSIPVTTITNSITNPNAVTSAQISTNPSENRDANTVTLDENERVHITHETAYPNAWETYYNQYEHVTVTDSTDSSLTVIITPGDPDTEHTIYTSVTETTLET